MIALAVAVIIVSYIIIVGECYKHCCHNSYHCGSDSIVDDLEINYTQLAMGVSQVQLLCLHAVVREGNCF